MSMRITQNEFALHGFAITVLVSSKQPFHVPALPFPKYFYGMDLGTVTDSWNCARYVFLR